MEELLKALEELKNRNDLLWPQDDEDYKRWFNMNLDEMSNVEQLANSVLIEMGGDCNWDNIRELKSHGYDVYRGEGDSFGWLTGCIEFKNNSGETCVVVYG